MSDGSTSSALAKALDDARRSYFEQTDVRRLRLYRTALQASIFHASPLGIAFARHLGFDLKDVLEVMGPPTFWPPTEGQLLRRPMRWEFQTGSRIAIDQVSVDRFYVPGATSIGTGATGDWICWQVVGGTLETAAQIGRVQAITRDGTLRIWLMEGLPEAVAMALPGRPLGALIDHEVLSSQGWTIGGVDDHKRGGQVLRLRIGQLPFIGPWPEFVAGLMLAHRSPSAALDDRRSRSA